LPLTRFVGIELQVKPMDLLLMESVVAKAFGNQVFQGSNSSTDVEEFGVDGVLRHRGLIKGITKRAVD